MTNCKDKTFVDMTITPPPQDTCVGDSVRIFYHKDTTYGKVQGLKNCTAWAADAFFYHSTGDPVTLYFLSFSEGGYLREGFAFSNLPYGKVQKYQLIHYTQTPANESQKRNHYSLLADIGDVGEDDYFVDPTKLDSCYLDIVRFDTIENVVEGSFSAYYNIKQPKYNPKNNDSLHFHQCKFTARLKQ